jgi:hypothetical protein
MAMEILTEKDLQELVEQHGEWSVSLYLPTHRSLPEARQDPIRFKNLLRQVENALSARGLRTAARQQYLKPAQELLGDSSFWRYQSDGLAIFLSVDEFRKYRLPISFRELSVVSDRYHIKPLISLLSDDDRFFVLALSRNNVRLIEGSRYGASEIDLENMPDGLKEILRSYDFEAQLQFHTRAQQAGGERAAVFHGQGGGIDDIKPKLVEYFRQIDEGLRERFKSERAPLVLAGVHSLFPLYRQVSTYVNLLDQGVAGNPESLNAEDLCNRALEIVEPHFLREREAASSRYHELAGTGRTSNDLHEIVAAARAGRIEILFVAVGVQTWGRLGDDGRLIVIHEKPEAGDRDLLDLCAVHTLLNRGLVYADEPNAVLGGGRIAAVFRY